MTQVKRKAITFCNSLAALSLMLIIPSMHNIYEILNNGKRGAYSLVTDFDKATPFLKIFILPYVSWYFFIFLTLAYLCLKDRQIYYKTLLTYIGGLMVCYLTYYFFQTTVPRPELVGNDLLTKMVSLIYAADEPFNAFPSIHAFSSYIMIKAINYSSIRNRVNSFVIKGVAISIILSTLFVKQHVVLDVFAAALLGEVIFGFVYNYTGVNLPLWRKKPYLLSMTKKKLGI